MTSRTAADDLALALDLADRADGISLARFGAADLRVDTKADNSPVTEADQAIEAMIRTRLESARPGDAVLGEEGGSSGDGEWRWIVDPIDGTRAYIAGRADWTISVALVEHGRPALAALYAPVTDEMFLAVRGEGATLNGVSMAASRGDTLERARLAGPKRYLDRLSGLTPNILAQPKVHSLALRLTRVAHGQLDAAFASGGSHDWDLAAADLLVHEAGGVMTDFAGRALSYNRPHVVHGALIAAGPARHGTLIELVRDRQAEFA